MKFPFGFIRETYSNIHLEKFLSKYTEESNHGDGREDVGMGCVCSRELTGTLTNRGQRG
jgi:hypothetical protein